jgi:hypothetical protein
MDSEIVSLYKVVRDLKLQMDSLKTMMFEHRPAFIETYNEITKRVAQTEAIRGLDERIAELEKTVYRRG